MRYVLKTSLISILCAAATAVSYAAPTVRSVGGTGTYDSAASAANATAASRAGSLRATGGYVRPTTSTSTSGTALKTATASTTTTTATTTGAVSKGSGSVGRIASTPRLSIGKYVGAPKSISTPGATNTDLTDRIEKLETDVAALETDKQDALKDSEYITVQGDELLLDVDKIKKNLDLRDGREVEMGTNEDGLLWRYVGETDWQDLISWADLRTGLNLGTIDANIDAKIAALRAELLAKIGEVEGKLGTKVDIHQPDGVGKALVVNNEGNVEATGEFVTTTELNNRIENINRSTVTSEDLEAKVDKDQGTGFAGKALVVGTNGIVAPTGDFANASDVYTKTEVYNKEEVDAQLNNRGGITAEDLENGLATKVDVHQPDSVGMALVVNSAGDVEATGDFVTPDELDNVVDNYQLDSLGSLAYMNSVGTEQIKNKSITSAKLSDGVADTLGQIQKWEDWWNENKPGEGDYVMSVQADGTRSWYRIVTAEE